MFYLVFNKVSFPPTFVVIFVQKSFLSNIVSLPTTTYLSIYLTNSLSIQYVVTSGFNPAQPQVVIVQAPHTALLPPP